MFRPIAAVFAVATLCLAWQESLQTLKLTRAGFDQNVTYYVTQELADAEAGFRLPTMGSTARPIFLALGDAARAGIVKELGLAAKALVTTPVFEAAYNARIKTSNNAVNHGIAVTDAAASMEAAAKSGNEAALLASTEMMVRDGMRQMAVSMGKQVGSWDANTVKEMADGIKDQMSSIPPKTAKEKAQHAQATVLLNDAKKLASTDLAGAKAKFQVGSLLAVYVDAGGGAGAAADDAKKEQQLNYNKRALRPNLKKKLLAFVAEAKSVDFKAATVAKGRNTVFVNAAYEKKTPMWKLIYRLGPGGATAAIAVAQAWAAEL